METGNGKWKWKLETKMEMRQSLARGIAHAQGCIAQVTAYRVEMVLCAAMEEGTESDPINLEDWRAVGLAEGCPSNPNVLDDEDSFASL